MASPAPSLSLFRTEHCCKRPHRGAFHLRLLRQGLQPQQCPPSYFRGSVGRVPYVLQIDLVSCYLASAISPIWTPSVMPIADALLCSLAGGRDFTNAPSAQRQATSCQALVVLSDPHGLPGALVVSLSPPCPTRPQGHRRNLVSL